MNEGFESSEEAVLQSYNTVIEEENGMRIYYPDFSDMHDEKCKFWDFLVEDDSLLINIQQKKMVNHSIETKHMVEEEKLLSFEENLSNSGIFWDFISSNGEESDQQLKCVPLKKSKPFQDSNLFYNLSGLDAQHINKSNCQRQSNFWDFIDSPDSNKLQKFVESKQINFPEDSSGIAIHQLNEISMEKKNESKDSNADEFWDFLNSNSSVDVDYKDVLHDVIDSTSLTNESELLSTSEKFDQTAKKSEMQIEENFTNVKSFQLPCISSVFTLKSFPNEDSKGINISEYQTDNLLTNIKQTSENKISHNAVKKRSYSMRNKKRLLRGQNTTPEVNSAHVIRKKETNLQQRTLSSETVMTNLCNSVEGLSGPIGTSTKKDEQLCLVLQNLKTLKDPNYSHFFVQLNIPQQINSLQNAPDLSNKYCPTTSMDNSSFEKQDIRQEDNFQKNTNKKVFTNPFTESNEEVERNKYLAGFRNKYIINLNNHKRRNESKLSVNVPKEIGAKCEMPLFSETLNIEDLNNILGHFNEQPQTTNKTKIEIIPNTSKHKQTKPIKRISLGKHKNAIQQINTPVKLEDLINKPVQEQKVYKITNRPDTKMQNELSIKNPEHTVTTTNTNMDHLVNKSRSDLLQISDNSEHISFNSDSINISTFSHSNMFANNDSILLPNKLTIGTVNNVHPEAQITTSMDTLASIQGLIPVSLSMLPVLVTPSQPVATKTLILQSSNHVEKSQIPAKETEISKRITSKLKGRRKTVKELLQERQRNSDPRKPPTNKREIKVLRPLCKIPITSDAQNTSTNIRSSGSSDHLNSTKRPNIMILPSASRPNDSLELQDRKRPFILNVSPLDVPLTPFCKSGEDGKDRRPRYYDLSELQIGYFKVEDDADASGRFRSKFKVIFTKCQFLYDFPVLNCNQPELKKADVCGQIARITIPFKSITSMSMRDRIIYICVNATPHMSLGMITSRSGKFSNICDTEEKTDSTWRDFLRSNFTHKVVLRKRQAGKLKSSLCQFDRKFISLMNTSIFGNLVKDERDPYTFSNEMSPNFHQTNAAKNKKSCIRRLPQWDMNLNGDQKSEDLLINQVCSCRTNCRYIRCSCVKAAKSCSFSGSMCQCINCNNPLNVLETIGMDIEFSIQDTCLFQNIYQIPELLNYLQKEVRLECCKSFARVQDCIPGTVLCPNVNCDARLEFSWCHRTICYTEYNPRNHCSFCGQCRFSSKYHCNTCKRCYAVSTKSISCPRCPKEQVVDTALSDKKPSLKPNLKPAIIVLQSSTAINFNPVTESQTVGE